MSYSKNVAVFPNKQAKRFDDTRNDFIFVLSAALFLSIVYCSRNVRSALEFITTKQVTISSESSKSVASGLLDAQKVGVSIFWEKSVTSLI